MTIEPSLNTWTTLFLAVAVHGLILASIFFYRQHGRKRPNILLGTLLFLFSLNLVSYVLYWSRYNLEFPHLTGITETFGYLYGPLLFFYALSILKPGRHWNKWDLVHLVPFILFLTWMMPYYLTPSETKVEYLTSGIIESMNNPGFSTRALISAGLKGAVMLGYGVIIAMLPSYLQKNNALPGRITEDTRKWVRAAGYGFMGYVISYVSYFVLVETIDFQVEYDYMISFTMSGFIFGIGYLNLLNPSIINEAHNGRFKYESSSLGNKQAEKYLEKLLDFMEQEKPYLEGDLKISDLADQLSIPSHHLSQIINDRLGKNFFEFVNSYRVEEAKKMLSDPGKSDFKILRVAFEAGFNNKTTFNIAFKEEVGTTPSSYRKQHVNGT